jgi:hypothetical protein
VGEGMSSRHIQDKIVKTRKDHRCCVCDEVIPAGSKVLARTTGDDNDGIFTGYFHDDCEEYSRDWEDGEWETLSVTHKEVKEWKEDGQHKSTVPNTTDNLLPVLGQGQETTQAGDKKV